MINCRMQTVPCAIRYINSHHSSKYMLHETLNRRVNTTTSSKYHSFLSVCKNVKNSRLVCHKSILSHAGISRPFRMTSCSWQYDRGNGIYSNMVKDMHKALSSAMPVIQALKGLNIVTNCYVVYPHFYVDTIIFQMDIWIRSIHILLLIQHTLFDHSGYVF